MNVAFAHLVADARGPDPTGTYGLRKSFRAAGKLRMNMFRSAMRQAVVEHDVLGLVGGALALQPPETKLKAFNGWMVAAAGQALGGPWLSEWIARAWASGEVAGARQLGTEPPGAGSGAWEELARVELDSIAAAVVQVITREAAKSLIKRRPSMTRVWQRISRAFDKVGPPRIMALANTFTVACHNRGRLASYRAAGIGRVGVIPEKLLPTQALLLSAGKDSQPRRVGGSRPVHDATHIGYSEKKQARSIEELAEVEEPIEIGVRTAEDEFVCIECDAFAANSPHDIDDVEDTLPIHINCRCTWFPWDDKRYRHDALDTFDPSQPRDPDGKWTGSGGGTSSARGGGRHPGEGYSQTARLHNGVIYTSDVEDAQRALHEGRKVDLKQLKSVSTLIKRLGEKAKEMEALGQQAPVYNLCDVSVAGTNIFCEGNKGIPRVEMPVIPAKRTKEFISYLKGRGYEVEKGREEARNLRATQSEIDGKKVALSMKRIKGEGFYKRLVISQDDYIVDGHHTWAGQLGLDAKDGDLEDDGRNVKVARVNIPILKLVEEAERFTGGAGKKAAGQDAWNELLDEMDAAPWNEASHTRGQPGNAGQFGPGGFGATSKPSAVPKTPGAVEAKKRERLLRTGQRERARALAEQYPEIAAHLAATGQGMPVAAAATAGAVARAKEQAAKPKGEEAKPGKTAEERATLEHFGALGGDDEEDKPDPAESGPAAQPAAAQPGAEKPAQKELFPGQFPPIPEPGKKVEPADFSKAKVGLPGKLTNPTSDRDKKAAEKFLENWNKNIGLAPEEFKTAFAGGSNVTMELDYDYGEYSEGEVATDSLTISGNVLNDAGRSIGRYTREIDFKNNEAESAYFSINSSSTGKNIGKQMLAANVAMYQKMGLDRVKVHANIDVGGYAWAKYGYVPTEDSWNDLRESLRSKAGEGGSGGYTPESWDELSDNQQEQAFDDWAERSRDEFMESEIESWRESGQSLDQAKQLVVDKFEPASGWAQDALDKFREGHPEIKVTNEDILKAVSIDYSSDGEGKADPDVTLAQVAEADLSELTDDHRQEIEDVLTDAVNAQAEKIEGDIDPPDHLGENISDYQREVWDGMRNRDRFEHAESAGVVEAQDDPDSESVNVSPEIMELLDEDDPKAIWDIADSPGGKDLLLGTDWYGAIDFDDPDSMARFNAYVGKQRGETK